MKRGELHRRYSEISAVCKIDPFLYFHSTLLLVRFSKEFFQFLFLSKRDKTHCCVQQPIFQINVLKNTMKISQIRRKNKQLGQGMTEYIIIVALIAVSAIGVYSLFGQTIRNQTAGLAIEMSGKTAGAQIGVAQGNAEAAATDANKTKGMGTYNNDTANGMGGSGG
jgi:Flp pilus assembly pilin Flp